MFGAKPRKKITHKELYFRTGVFAAVVVVLFIVLAVRLFDVQIINNEEFSTKSSNNQVRVITTPAKRGCIYDANMQVLADSTVVFAISVDISDLSSEEKDLVSKNLAGYLKDPSITEESIRDLLSANAGTYEPVVIKRVNYKDYIGLISVLEEHKNELPGLYISEEPQRTYPQESVAGHIIGYVGSLTEDDKDLMEMYNYKASDVIGKSGLEKTMERFTDDEGNEIGLRGIKGMKTVEVDSNHNIIRTLSEEKPISGNSVILTINSTVQKAMEDSLEETVKSIQSSRSAKCKGGAAVMVDVKTGGIIAMASYPNINPNDFIDGMDSETSDYYLNNDAKPLMNRAIQSTYPTGSTFKPMTAIAALINDSITPETSVVCKKSNWVPPMASCTGEHMTVNLKSATAVSCNTYFQTIGKLTGIDKLAPVFKKLGYGQLTGIELPSEQKGVLATPAWKQENFGESWRIYDTYYMSMGQGYINNTVLQMANATATIANGGNRMQTYLVSKIINTYNDTVYQHKPTVVETLGGDASDFTAVKDAMRQTCVSGTAARLFGGYPVKVCAKTGTAQTGLKGDDKDNDYHGWFIAFAPYDDPQVAFAGIIEYGYHGSTSAGYVCKDAFNAYFGLTGQQSSYGVELYDSEGNLVDSAVVE